MATLAASGSGPNPAKENSHGQQEYERPTDPSLYVGSETCKTCQTCHEEIFKNFETSPHWETTFSKKRPEWQGCEGCHGPGKAHVEGGGDKSKIRIFKGKPAEQASTR